MSEGKVVLRARGPRRSRGEIEVLVAEYEASGLTRKAFCRERGLGEATLDLYGKRMGKAKPAARPMALDLESPARSALPQELSPQLGASVLTVVLGNGRRIELGGSLDGALLAELIVVLERP